MAKEPLAFISHGTIGRTRATRQHPETGLPIEESVPTLGSLVMYDRHGNQLRIPTRCHRAALPALTPRYEPRLIADLLDQGYVQEGVCPHMPREQLGGRSSVPAPAGYAICDGRGELDPVTRVGGCQHLKKVVAARVELAKKESAERDSTAGKAALLTFGQGMAAAAAKVAEADAKLRAQAATGEPAGKEPGGTARGQGQGKVTAAGA